MTDPIVRLEQSALTVEPGGQTTTVVTVRNLGTIVEGFRLDALGEGVAEWTSISPPEVQVYPEQEATAVVVFAPPQGTRSGTFPFAVRAESVVDAATSALAEGDLEIGRVFGLQSKITPVTSSGRWRGRHFLEITNWGNAPVRLKITASDPDDRLAFLVGPDTLDLPLGVTGHAQLRVRTLKPYLRGAKERLPFQVVAEPEDAEPPTPGPGGLPPGMINPRRTSMDGAFVQRPILSRWTVVAAIGAVLVAGGLTAFALTRGSDAQQAELVTGPPLTPALTSVTAPDATSVALQWERQPNISSYKINQLTEEGVTTGALSVDGQLNAYVVKELAPRTAYCFQLQAVRGDQASGFSEQRCATTTEAPPASESPQPSSLSPSPTEGSAGPSSGAGEPTAAPSSPNGAAVSGGEQQPPGGVVVPPGQGGPGASTAPGPGTGAGAGVTATGGPGGTTGGGTAPGGVPTFGPNQFISVFFSVPASDSDPQGRAEAIRQQFVAQGVPAQVLRTADFPDLRLTSSGQVVDSYLLYVGPFNSQADGRARCTAAPSLGSTCIVVRPSPNG